MKITLLSYLTLMQLEEGSFRALVGNAKAGQACGPPEIPLLQRPVIQFKLEGHQCP
jgi:hypothetical protein